MFFATSGSRHGHALNIPFLFVPAHSAPCFLWCIVRVACVPRQRPDCCTWTTQDLNLQLPGYEPDALPIELMVQIPTPLLMWEVRCRKMISVGTFRLNCRGTVLSGKYWCRTNFSGFSVRRINRNCLLPMSRRCFLSQRRSVRGGKMPYTSCYCCLFRQTVVRVTWYVRSIAHLTILVK